MSKKIPARPNPRFIDQLKSLERDYQVGDESIPNLFLIVRPSGVKRWIYDAANICNMRSRRIKMSLGTYPAFTIGDARDWAEEQNRLRGRGIDPRDAKAEAEKAQDRIDANTVKAAHETYIEAKSRDGIRRLEEKTRLMERNVFPTLGDRSLASITKADVRDVLNPIRARGKDGAANRVLAEIKAFMNWCEGEDLIEVNVAQSMRKTREIGFRRDVTEQEMAWIWRAAGEYEADERDAIRMIVLTGARKMEVMGSALGEFRNGLWTIPRERAKNELAAVLPLGPMGRAIFTAARERSLKLRRSFHFHAAPYPSMGAKLLKRLRADVAALAARENETVEHWDFHSIRHGVRTNITQGKAMNKELAEMIINHATGGIDRRYDKNLYIDDKRDLLTAWEERILSLADVKQAQRCRAA